MCLVLQFFEVLYIMYVNLYSVIHYKLSTCIFVHQHVKGRLFTLIGISITVKNTTVLSNDQCLSKAKDKTPRNFLRHYILVNLFCLTGWLVLTSGHPLGNFDYHWI